MLEKKEKDAQRGNTSYMIQTSHSYRKANVFHACLRKINTSEVNTVGSCHYRLPKYYF